MIEITIKNHLGVLIGSIEKIYKRAQLIGKLEIIDIYYLNIIYKLLNKLELTNDENNQLIDYYNKLSFYSENICPPKVIKKYQTTPKPKFEQAENTDCNTVIKNQSILYWQEVYTLNNSQITELVDDTNYLVNIPSDTYENFELGKNIDYTKIGKIVFLALESNTTDYIVKDGLDNNVTHTFNIQLIPELNATLFISDNTYSHGIMKFKIIKQ
jgi:hypothetical protein